LENVANIVEFVSYLTIF